MIAVIVTYALVVPRMGASGNPEEVASLDLDAGQPLPGLKASASTIRNPYGFVVAPFDVAKVTFALPRTLPVENQRTVLLITAGAGPGVSTELSLLNRDGSSHPLGRPERWTDRTVDVTSLIEPGGARLQFTSTNSGPTARLFADRVRAITYPASAIPHAGRWEVAGLVMLLVLLGLVALRRARRDAVLVGSTGLLAFLVWPSIVDRALSTPSPGPWSAALRAKWLDLDGGLLSGTFDTPSHLTVQLFHAVSFATGSGLTGARVGSMAVGLLALIAIYYLARRVAGQVGAVAAVACALLTDAFRASLVDGGSTPTLVLTACLFLLAAHRVLQRGDRGSMILLGAAGAIAILAEPLWWPGVVAALVLLALRYAPHEARPRTALVVGLAALALVSLPSRLSVLSQSGGDVNADVIRQATEARNVEFLGDGHGAPPDESALAADPDSGPQVGLGDYVFGDHGLPTVVGGVVSGAYDGVSAAAARPDSKLVGLLAFLVEIVGVVVLLLLPRLRLLVVIAAMMSVVPWFFASRGASLPFNAGAAFFPALLLGAATVAYMAAKAWRERFGEPAFLAGIAARAGAVTGRQRSSQPS